MQTLPPIPVPLSTRWREFRTRVLPVCTALVVAIAAVLLWRQAGVSGNFPGVAEGIRTTVASPQPAAVRQLIVQPYQVVQVGDPVAVIVPNDPRTELELLQTELQLARFGVEPSVPEQNALAYERLRLELLRMQSELAKDKVDLQRAANQVRRQTPLFEEKLVSEDLFDLAVKTRDSIQAEVHAKSNAVVQMSRRMDELRSLGEPPARARTDPAQVLLSSLGSRHRCAVTNWGPMTLTAPIDGMVSAVLRQAGEHLLAGEPLLVISSHRADRLVGYLRQPYTVRAEIGMQALLSTREWNRRRYLGTVSQIGAQVEFITNYLAVLRPGALVDAGLPVVIDLPPDTPIRPGEIIDIEIRAGPSVDGAPLGQWSAERPLLSHRGRVSMP
jgi:multidrug resistance efflux pump